MTEPRRVHVCLIFLGLLQLTDSRCKTHICLTWTFENDELMLSCKLDSGDGQDYTIVFYQQSKRAFCVPSDFSGVCRSFVTFSNITQNNITRETVFKIYGKSLNTANGRWTCTFGTNIVNSSTEVTIPDTSDSTNNSGDNTSNSGLRCLHLRLFYTLIAFVSTLGIIRLIEEYKHISEIPKIGLVAKKIAAVTATLPKLLKVFFMFCGLCLLFVIPTIAGEFDEACNVKGAFSIYGIFMGCLAYVHVILGPTGNHSKDAPENSNDSNGGDPLRENREAIVLDMI